MLDLLQQSRGSESVSYNDLDTMISDITDANFRSVHELLMEYFSQDDISEFMSVALGNTAESILQYADDCVTEILEKYWKEQYEEWRNQP
jgi:hypothetical protein